MRIGNKVLKYETLFLFAYVLILFSNMFCQIKYYPIITNIFEYIGLLIICVIIILNYKKINYRMLLILLIGVISMLTTKDKNILKFSIILMGSTFVDFNKIIKTDFKFRSIFFILVVVCNQIGLMNAVNVFRYDGTVRYSLGFIHPNTFALNVFIIVLDEYYLNYIKGSKINIKLLIRDLLLYIFAFCIILFVSNTKSCCLIILMLMLTLFLKNIIYKIYNNKFIMTFLKNLFLIFLILSFIIAFFYNSNSNFYKKLDDVLSSRVTIWNHYTENYDISIFGQVINETSKQLAKENHLKHYPLDNGYLYMLYVQGLVVTIMYVILFYKLIKYALKNKLYILLNIIILILIYGIIESNFCNINNNVFVLAFSYIFSKGKRREVD